MKNKIHICGTWYVLLRSPYKFRLSEMHSEKIYTYSANLTDK